MIPIGYLSRHQAIAVIAAAKFAGVPDRSAVIEARQAGHDPADGVANDDAIAELWRAVDQDRLDAFAHGPGDRLLKMNPEDTKRVPGLRGARGGDFTFLRPDNPFHSMVVSQFGSSLGLVSLIFPQLQVERLAGLVRRRRRQATANSATRKPSRKDLVFSIVRKTVEEERWNPTMPLVALARSVERSHNWGNKVPSEDSVTRALDKVYEATGDRRFQRTRRKSRTSESSDIIVHAERDRAN
jgi:hypothetical protein